MNAFWNRLDLSQKLDLQDTIRWGTLFVACVAMLYGIVSDHFGVTLIGLVWSAFFWSVQLLYKEGD